MAVITKSGAPVLGLDIGAAFIKAVEMRPGKGALSITGVGVLPTPPGCIVNDEIVDPVVLAAAVKQLLAENGIKTKSVVASVSGQASVVIRVIEVPRMTDKELAETMRWEIDRHIPFSPDEVVKDFAPLKRATDDPNSANMSVLLAVAQNGTVGGLLQTILAAGLTPVAIDVEALAGARSALDVDDAFNTQTVALVNIGATKTDVGIYESGALAFPRTIPVAGNAMTEAVARTLAIDGADAERVKKQHGEIPADAHARFGSAATAATEETFDFGDFGSGDFGAPTTDYGAPGTDYSAPMGGFAAMPDGPDFGAGGFAATHDGPVFDDPMGASVGTAPFGAPAGGFAATPDGPVFAGGFEVPAFGSEPPVPAAEPTITPSSSFAAPAFGAAEGPTFDLPDVGPANTGPVDAFDAAPIAAAPPEPPRAAEVPEVLDEATRHRREISDAFMPVVAELAGEVKRSLEYYSTRANNAHVDRVIVFGGASAMPGLNAFLEAELGVPVFSAGLPRSVSLASSAITPGYLNDVTAMLPVAVGLAARDAIA